MSKNWILPLLILLSTSTAFAAGNTSEISYQNYPNLRGNSWVPELQSEPKPPRGNSMVPMLQSEPEMRNIATPGFDGVCIYTDNLNKGSIIKENIKLEGGGKQVFSLVETKEVLDATFMVVENKKYLVVIDSRGIIIGNVKSDLGASTSFLTSFKTDPEGSAQASVVCVPN